MKIQNIQSQFAKNNEVSFGINISNSFTTKMRRNFNSGNLANRNQIALAFNKTAEKYINRFGYDNYTLDMEQSILGGIDRYTLVAIRDGSNGMNRTVITQQNSIADLIDKFLMINKQEFDAIMKRGQSLKSPNL